MVASESESEPLLDVTRVNNKSVERRRVKRRLGALAVTVVFSVAMVGMAVITNKKGDQFSWSAKIQQTTQLEITYDNCVLPDTPVLGGTDVVAYFSLKAHHAAVMGVEKHSSTYNAYTYWFASDDNKALFDADPEYYVPAWGGFCSYGIAYESNYIHLGPAVQPDQWLIMPDGRLHVFRAGGGIVEAYKDQDLMIELGNASWELLAGEYDGYLFNTHCLCSLIDGVSSLSDLDCVQPYNE